MTKVSGFVEWLPEQRRVELHTQGHSVCLVLAFH